MFRCYINPVGLTAIYPAVPGGPRRTIGLANNVLSLVEAGSGSCSRLVVERCVVDLRRNCRSGSSGRSRSDPPPGSSTQKDFVSRCSPKIVYAYHTDYSCAVVFPQCSIGVLGCRLSCAL